MPDPALCLLTCRLNIAAVHDDHVFTHARDLGLSYTRECCVNEQLSRQTSECPPALLGSVNASASSVARANHKHVVDLFVASAVHVWVDSHAMTSENANLVNLVAMATMTMSMQ